MRTRHFLPSALLALSVLASAENPQTKPPASPASEPGSAVAAKPAAKKRDDPVARIAATLEPTRQIVYKKVGDRELHLHVFEPKGHKAGDQRACFITIHGGGWTNGDARKMYPFAAHFAGVGLVGISIEYRLLKSGPGVTVFDCVKDGRSAVRYVRTHAAELGVDPHKIIANGGSACGHVAASTALFDGIDEAGEDTKVSCVPDALVLLYPVIDTSKEGYGNVKCGPQWQDLSPVHHVRAGLPPTIVFHGTGDTVTPFKGAKAFHEAMLKAGNRCELDINEDGKHGYLIFDLALYEDTLRKTDAFLESLGFLKREAK